MINNYSLQEGQQAHLIMYPQCLPSLQEQEVIEQSERF